MPLFVCDKCGCVENTAVGFFWSSKTDETWWADPELKGKALCSECAPDTFSDGSKSGYGKWHGIFEKKQWDGKTEVMNREKVEK